MDFLLRLLLLRVFDRLTFLIDRRVDRRRMDRRDERFDVFFDDLGKMDVRGERLFPNEFRYLYATDIYYNAIKKNEFIKYYYIIT